MTVLEEKVFDALNKFDGHITNGSFAGAMKLLSPRPIQTAFGQEELMNVLTRFEGAVQQANDEVGDAAAEQELIDARAALLVVLQEARTYARNNDEARENKVGTQSRTVTEDGIVFQHVEPHCAC